MKTDCLIRIRYLSSLTPTHPGTSTYVTWPSHPSRQSAHEYAETARIIRQFRNIWPIVSVWEGKGRYISRARIVRGEQSQDNCNGNKSRRVWLRKVLSKITKADAVAISSRRWLKAPTLSPAEAHLCPIVHKRTFWPRSSNFDSCAPIQEHRPHNPSSRLRSQS